MAVTFGDVPLLDPVTGLFPDRFTPAAATQAVADAEAARDSTLIALGEAMGPIAMPSNLVPTLPCTFTRDVSGVISHDMDFDQYRTGTQLWVNATTGNDTNAGTETLPVRSITKAWDLALAGSGDYVIRITGPAHLNRSFSTVGPRTVTGRRISMIGEGATPVMLSTANAALTWTADGATTWKATRSSVYAVFSAQEDANGVPIPITPAASLVACQATVGTWYTDNVYVWINTGGVAPTTTTHHVSLLQNLMTITLGVGGAVYLENLTLLSTGSADHVKIIGGTGNGAFVANNCRFVGARQISPSSFNGLACTDVGMVALFDCIAAHAERDGLNHHFVNTATPRQCLVLEYNCLSYGHGTYDTSGNNNATTVHEGATVVRIGCEGHTTSGPVLADVGGCMSVCVDCHMHDSTMATKDAYLFMDTSGEAWLTNCAAGGLNQFDLYATVPVYISGRFRGHRISAPVVNWL